MQERDVFFDNAKFILIFLVVLGHFIENVQGSSFSALYKLIYTFHMPCFIFILGYFTKKLTLKNITFLIYTYFVFQTLQYSFIVFVLKAKNIYFPYIAPGYAMWFIMSMLWWKISILFLNKKPYVLFLSVLIGALFGYFNLFPYLLSNSRAIVFFPFFILGYFFQEKYILKIKPLWAIIIFIISYLLIKFFIKIPIPLLQGVMKYNSFDGFFRIGLYAFSLLLMICFFSLVPIKKTWFSVFGQRTMNVYLLHIFVVLFLVDIELPKEINSTLIRVVYIISALILTIILSTKPIDNLMNYIYRPLMRIKIMK